MKIFIGYDSRFDDAYQVAKHSLSKVNSNLKVYPLKLDNFKNIILREKDSNYADANPMNNQGDSYQVKYETSFS